MKRNTDKTQVTQIGKEESPVKIAVDGTRQIFQIPQKFGNTEGGWTEELRSRITTSKVAYGKVNGKKCSHLSGKNMEIRFIRSIAYVRI